MKIFPRNMVWALRNALLQLVLMSLFRIAFWMVFPNPAPENEWGAFWLGLRYDIRFTAVPALIIWMFSLLPALNPFLSRTARRLWNAVYLVLILLLLIIYAADFAHYGYLRQRLNANVLGYLQDAAISSEMAWESYPIVSGLVVITVFMTLMFWILRYNYRCTERHSLVVHPKQKKTSSVLFFFLLIFLIYGRAGTKPLRWSDAFKTQDDYSANLSLNPLESFESTIIFKNPAYDMTKVEAHYYEMADYLGVTRPDIHTLNLTRTVASKDTPGNKKPNVVLVICESFSGYKSSMWGNPLNATPFFNSLCKEGIFFDRCFAPSYNTARGVWAILTGVPDVSIISTNTRRAGMESQHSIVNDFRGYEKYYFLGGSANWANLRSLFKNSIDSLHLYEQKDFHLPKADVWGVSDKNVFLGANQVLAKQCKPFFAIIQTADNHRPYTIAAEDRKAFTSDKVPLATLHKYGFDNAAEYKAFRYTDFCFQQFMNAAQKETYYANTIFVFVGDHGIPGNAGTMLPAIWTQQDLTAHHVPLLFYQPALLQPRRLSWPVSQMDILPTIAGICGIGYTNTTMGMDLLDTARSAFFKTGKKWTPVFNDLKLQAGTMQGDVFYQKPFSGEPGELYSSVDNRVPAKNDSLTHALDSFTEAWLQWSRYLALHNKKLRQ